MDQIARSSKLLGAILRRYRKQNALTQTEVADKTRLRQATISVLETGEDGTQLGTLMRVLSALDLELVVRPRTKGRTADIDEIF